MEAISLSEMPEILTAIRSRTPHKNDGPLMGKRPYVQITVSIIIIIIIIIIITAIQLSLGGSSPYTSTDRTNKN
jgi:hypothetical protein